MFATLRNRLILSHVLPLLIIVPLMGIVLIIALETRYFIPNLSRSLEGDARLVADFGGESPAAWSDPAAAQAMLDRIEPVRSEQISFFDLQGRLLATSQAFAAPDRAARLAPGDIEPVRAGQTLTRRRAGSGGQGDIIEVLTPVKGDQSQVFGIVRLDYRYQTFYQEFIGLRYLIGGILLFGLLIGAGLALVLAINIGNPLRQVTEAVYDLSSGRRSEPLPERGPAEVRQLQKAANHLVERLHEVEESRRRLLANLIHELGRPLGALRAAIQALSRGAKADPALLDELLEGMDQETIRLQRLTEDLAELHDQVFHSLKLDLHPIDLCQWLPIVLRPWQAAAAERRIAWEVNLPDGFLILQADPDRLAQMIGNLVSNAIKYTPPGGRVTITAGSQEGQVWVRVADTGRGIPVEEQEKVFTPFYHNPDRIRYPQGMGLGLSIAQDLAVAHGGKIELQSQPGKGSSFSLFLPAPL